jgi:hypothetical protein
MQVPHPDQTRHTYAQLIKGFIDSEGQATETRWQWLAAAHVVGQNDLTLHWSSHRAMLRFALETRDYTEVRGQLFRIALVPLGHLLGRLPAGNIGRATVNAFAPMAPEPRLQQMIVQAQTRPQ